MTGFEMTSTLLSPLSRGCGSWDGDVAPETKQTLAKSTHQPISTKKDASRHLDKSLSIPLRTKKDNLALIRDILQDTQPATATKSKSYILAKSLPAKSLPSNYVDVIRANTPKPNKPQAKVFTPYGGFNKTLPDSPPTHKQYSRYQPEKLPSNSPPVVRPKTAATSKSSRVQSAVSSSLSDRIKSAPARRRVRTKTAPPGVEKRALIPKTLTTRKGALLLFAAPGDFDFTQEHGAYVPMGPPNIPELGTKLGTTRKLAASVLQYGNENFPSDLESFNSQYEKTCMRFSQEDDDDFTLDYRAQPGGDFVFYLRDMQARQMVRSLVRSPSLQSLSSINTVEELNEALHSIEIDGVEVMGPGGDEFRGQRSELITADADRLAETISRPSTAGLDAISRPTTGISRASTSKTGLLSRPGTSKSSKSMCSTPLSADKLAASIKSAPYLGHPIQAPYPSSMTSIDNYQEEVQSTRSGPGSRPGSVNSIRSVTIKSRSRSSIQRPESAMSRGTISEHDEDVEGSMVMSEGASEHNGVVSEGQRSVSQAAISHRQSWPEDGSDVEGVMEEAVDLSRPNSSRPVSTRRSRQSSARRSASLKDRSRSHISGTGSVGNEEELQEEVNIEEATRSPLPRQPSAKSVKSVTMAIEEEKEDENWPEGGAEDMEEAHSSHYGSRPASRRSQFSYASASTSLPMGSEPDLDFPQGDDQQQMEQPADDFQPQEEPAAPTPKAVTPIVGTPSGTKSQTPRPPSSHHSKSIASDHPPSEKAVDENEPDSAADNIVPEENVEEVVEEVMNEVVEEADEAQDFVLDLSNIPKGRKISKAEAQDDIARALQRHSQSSSLSGQDIVESEGEDSVMKVPSISEPATVAPLKAPSPPPEPIKVPPAMGVKKRVSIAATPIKAKSRSPSPTAKVSAPETRKSSAVDLSDLMPKPKSQPARIPPPAKKEKKGGGKKKKGGGGGRAKSRSPPPFKMEFIDSVVVEKFEEPTEEEFEKMLQEELAQELAENNQTGLLKKDKEEEKPVEVEDDVNSLATDDEAIEKEMKETNKGKKKNKKQMDKQKAALKEERRQEKLRREEEMRQMQEKKKQIEAEKRRQEEEDRRRREDLAEQLQDAEEEARMAAEAEEEARQMLQDARKTAREEREAKRKADIEKKKIERELQRESRKKMEEAARDRERDMAERLASAAERKKMREEAEYEQQERDRIEREQREYEEEEERIRLQEEEDRIAEMEKQSEEEAMQRLIKERQEADRKRREAMKEAERMKQIEDIKRQEELKKEAEEEEKRRLQALEDDKRRMEELERNAELKLWEEKARDRVRRKIESRRQYLLKIRDKNRERRTHLNSVRQTQGMTQPWVYSYYVHWNRDTYEKRLPSKKKDGRRMKPKPPPKPPGDEGEGGAKMADTGT